MRIRFLVFVGVLLALPLAAQQLRESVTVEVIDVPVYVTRANAPVDGLTRDDFELYVNGKRQPIEYFDSLTADAPATLRERRLFLLLFDIAFTHPHSLLRAQRAAAEAMAKAGPADYFAVATYSARRGVRFAVPFTRDHAALTRAVASLSESGSGDPLSIVMTSAERETFGEWSAAVSDRVDGETLRDMTRARTIRAAEEQVLDLGDLAERLAPLDGEKHVVLLSEGFDGRVPQQSDVRVMTFNQQRELGQPRLSAIVGRSWDHTLHMHIERMHQGFQRANVLLHSIDVEGLTNTRMTNDALGFLAEGTGGQFLTGRNDLGRALNDLSGELARGYRLGFRVRDARSDYNTIRVKVREPRGTRGTRVNYRRGFFGTPLRGNVHDGVIVADVLLNDVPQSGTAAALELRGRTLTATVPMRELAAQAPAGRNAELLLYAFDAGGAALFHHREMIEITESEQRTIEITVPEGTRVAKALLRVDGLLGFSRTP